MDSKKAEAEKQVGDRLDAREWWLREAYEAGFSMQQAGLLWSWFGQGAQRMNRILDEAGAKWTIKSRLKKH